MAMILDFRSSTDLLVQDRKRKIDFQDGGRSHLGYPIGNILAVLIYKAPRCFLPIFELLRLSVQEEKRKIHFQDGRHGDDVGFSIRTILAIFIYRSPRCFMPSFESIGPGM